jgi:hypothetical protein
MLANGFPVYKRHKCVGDGPAIRLPSNSTFEVTLNNNWMVPYNPYLSKKYKVHINLELYGGVLAVKYIHGYVYNGEGSVTLHIAQNPDEIGT